MITPTIPLNETDRISDLHNYSVLDTLPESEYDAITQMASEICDTPISLISLIDEKRQWFKAHTGLDATETHRDYAFCAHAINSPDKVFEVPDSRIDERFFDNPLATGAPHVVFYTGVPLVSPQGYALGTLCVIDHKPKALTNSQINALKALSNQVITLLELRKHKEILEKNKAELEARNQALDAFARIVAHDIKSPLSNISGLAQLLKHKHSSKMEFSALELMDMIDTSANQVTNLVDGILEYSRSGKVLEETKTHLKVSELLQETVAMVAEGHEVLFPASDASIYSNKTALQQILINLLTNAIKYNDKEKVKIEIDFNESSSHYAFRIVDNGIGIAEKNLTKIFDLFEIATLKDRKGQRGNGVGLSTVKKLVEGLGGKIWVSSILGAGTTFEFKIAK